MSDLGIFAAKLYLNSNSLRQFNSTLRSLKNTGVNSKISPSEKNNLLEVLSPISEKIKGKQANVFGVNERALVDSLHQRHPTDWQQYKDSIISITNKLESEDSSITENDIMVLEDVADALDAECANLFRKISGRL